MLTGDSEDHHQASLGSRALKGVVARAWDGEIEGCQAWKLSFGALGSLGSLEFGARVWGVKVWEAQEDEGWGLQGFRG